MKTILLPYFDNDKIVRGVIFKDKGRRYVNIKSKSTGLKYDITYAKYILSFYLERNLTSEETVDHYDRDHLNDSLFNLRVLDFKTHVKEDRKRAALIKLKCVLCSTEVLRKTISTKRGHAGPFCKSCLKVYASETRKGIRIPLEAQPRVDSEFFYLEKEENNTITDHIRAKDLDKILDESISNMLILSFRESSHKFLNRKIPRKIVTYPHFDPQCYGVCVHTDKNSTRKFIYIKNKETGYRKKTSYARYLMEQYLGRYLEKDEWVDHINRDHTDDRIENLQIVDPVTSGKIDAKRVNAEGNYYYLDKYHKDVN